MSDRHCVNKSEKETKKIFLKREKFYILQSIAKMSDAPADAPPAEAPAADAPPPAEGEGGEAPPAEGGEA